jgi:hypothetical protein
MTHFIENQLVLLAASQDTDSFASALFMSTQGANIPMSLIETMQILQCIPARETLRFNMVVACCETPNLIPVEFGPVTNCIFANFGR